MSLRLQLHTNISHKLGEVSPTELTVAPNRVSKDEPSLQSLSSSDTQPTKINVSGLNDQVTDDLVNFASELFPSQVLSKRDIEWINDESANFVYPSPELALAALASFSADTGLGSSMQPLQPRPTKPTTVCPNHSFQVRIAVLTDRKQARAHEASRFYLLHPEHDPREKMRKEFGTGRRPRRPRGADGEANGDYHRNRYDDEEHNRRLRNANGDSTALDFSASMYDDDTAVSDSGPQRLTNNNRRRKRDLFEDDHSDRNGRGRSASPLNTSEIELDALSDDDANYRNKRRRNNFRARSPISRQQNAGRELFEKNNAGKELFNNSSTTMLQSTTEALPNDSTIQTTDPTLPSTANNRLRAANLRKELLTTSPPQREPFLSNDRNSQKKELFPAPATPKELFSDKSRELFPSGGRSPTNKPHHRRSDAEDFDSPNSSLSNSFSRLPHPLVDGAVESENGLAIKGTANKGLNIKGRGMRIKGMGVRELFPEKYATGGKGGGTTRNEGKELFDHVLEGRGNRGKGRVKAGDLFG